MELKLKKNKSVGKKNASSGATVTKETKQLTLINVVSAIFTSVFLVDAIIPGASTGPSTFIWYIIFGVAFFIPYGLVVAEFSSKIPEEGGVYAWVKKTLGVGSAKRVAWYYWVNVGIWAPSIALYIATTMQAMWFPDYNNIWVIAVISIAFMWASLAFAYFPITENKFLYTMATAGKVLIVIFIFIGAFVWLGGNHESATDFTHLKSDLSGDAVLVFLPALIYNALGFEAVSGEASKVKNMKKTMPRAILIVVCVLLIFYITTTLSIQYVFDVTGNAGTVALDGLISAFQTAFGDSVGATVLVNVLGLIFIFTMFVETMGWVSGANASVSESTINGELPKVFNRTNKHGMPFLSSIMLGLIGTICIVLFTAIEWFTGLDTVFWSLFGASSNILFLSYILMFAAYIKGKWSGVLEKLDGFTLPGGKWSAIPMALLALIILTITWFLLVWSPGFDALTQTLPIVICVLAAIGAGELCFLYAKHKGYGIEVQNNYFY